MLDQVHVCKASASPFASGGLRSFLEYRDLGVRDATEGRWRASLSRTREQMDGGTGIHRHVLDVQFIYVLNGSATFEYADFGEFAVVPGDCIYQPSTITHQQTWRSKDCVVMEVVSPAAFPTTDTGIEPYEEPLSDATVGKQAFSIVRAAETSYQPHQSNAWMRRRDLGIRDATGGRVTVQLNRMEDSFPGPQPMAACPRDFTLLFTLQGIGQMDLGERVVNLIPGDCVYLPRGYVHAFINMSDDYEYLEITSPGA